MYLVRANTLAGPATLAASVMEEMVVAHYIPGTCRENPGLEMLVIISQLDAGELAANTTALAVTGL